VLCELALLITAWERPLPDKSLCHREGAVKIRRVCEFRDDLLVADNIFLIYNKDCARKQSQLFDQNPATKSVSDLYRGTDKVRRFSFIVTIFFLSTVLPYLY
jgi:hypothetical protein